MAGAGESCAVFIGADGVDGGGALGGTGGAAAVWEASARGLWDEYLEGGMDLRESGCCHSLRGRRQPAAGTQLVRRHHRRVCDLRAIRVRLPVAGMAADGTRSVPATLRELWGGAWTWRLKTVGRGLNSGGGMGR